MTGKTVLIVDDEPNIRDVLTQFLDFGDYQTYSAANGEDGLRQLRERQPDLIISDVLMPGMNGYEFCQHVREASDVPILMLSGQVDMEEEEDKVQSMNLGVNALMSKPIRMDEFLETVAALLSDGNGA